MLTACQASKHDFCKDSSDFEAGPDEAVAQITHKLHRSLSGFLETLKLMPVLDTHAMCILAVCQRGTMHFQAATTFWGPGFFCDSSRSYSNTDFPTRVGKLPLPHHGPVTLGHPEPGIKALLHPPGTFGSSKDASGRIATVRASHSWGKHSNAASALHPPTRRRTDRNAPLPMRNLFKITKQANKPQSLHSHTQAGVPTLVLMKADTSNLNVPIKRHRCHHRPPPPAVTGGAG